MDAPPPSLPDDIDTLKRLLLEQHSINAEHSQLLSQKQTRIERLEELLRLLHQQQFGQRSEKHADQLSLFNEVELLSALAYARQWWCSGH